MPSKSNILSFSQRNINYSFESKNRILTVKTQRSTYSQYVAATCIWCLCALLSICMSAGMPSIEWKWSEWIPLAELSALVAHTVGRSATETAQHCMATHRANQASRWHSLDNTQERYTEKKKQLRGHGNSIHRPFWTDTVSPFTQWSMIAQWLFVVSFKVTNNAFFQCNETKLDHNVYKMRKTKM